MNADAKESGNGLRDADYSLENMKIVDSEVSDVGAEAPAPEDKPLGSVFDLTKEREQEAARLKQAPSAADKMIVRSDRAGRYVKLTFVYIGLCALTMGAALSIKPDSSGIILLSFAVLALVTYAYGLCWLIRGILGIICSIIWPPRSRFFLYILGMFIATVGITVINVAGLSLQMAVKRVSG